MSNLESNLHSEIAKIDEYNKELDNLTEQNKIISDLEIKSNEYTEKLDKYDKYIELTSMTGTIYEEILKKLAIRFTSTEVRYDIESGIYRNNRYINFNSYYLVKNKYRLYELCSDGQKIICDLDFLSKLFSINVGLLVLDEYLKSLDENNFPKACEIISNMNVNTILLSTHDQNLAVYTKRILLQLDEEGKTIAKVV